MAGRRLHEHARHGGRRRGRLARGRARPAPPRRRRGSRGLVAAPDTARALRSRPRRDRPGPLGRGGARRTGSPRARSRGAARRRASRPSSRSSRSAPARGSWPRAPASAQPPASRCSESSSCPVCRPTRNGCCSSFSRAVRSSRCRSHVRRRRHDTRCALAAHARPRPLRRQRDVRPRALPCSRAGRGARVRRARADARAGRGRRSPDRGRDGVPGLDDDPGPPGGDGSRGRATRRPSGLGRPGGRRPLPAHRPAPGHGAAHGAHAPRRAAPRPAAALPAGRAALPAPRLRPGGAAARVRSS